jgi:PASTA domain
MSTSPTPPTGHWDASGHDPSRPWGTSPTPPGPKPKRGGRILLAAAIGVALLVVTAVVANGSPTDNRPAPTPTPPTIPSPDPEPIPSPDPPTTPSPDPEPETVDVPELIYMTRAEAKQVLADLGLKATTKYKFTDQDPAGTVISQSPKAGARVLPDTTVSLVVAKTPSAPAPEPPPPPPSTAPPPPSTDPPQTCDPSYPDVCLDPAVGDYDCAGGTGNGPGYIEGPIRVLPPDPFGLDGNSDGWGCENG